MTLNLYAVGNCTLDLKAFIAKVELTQVGTNATEKRDHPIRVEEDTVGEVLISLKCLPTAQRIEVGLLKVKCASLSISPHKDVYARIDIFGNQRKQKHQKSTLRAKSNLIVFNETFQFTLPDPVTKECLVLISMYQVQSTGKSLIGQASLGSGSNEDDHWQLMMQSARQPVAKWHPLLI
ncbi:hypothetical protein NDU88_004071 [Pleurodeles waltl]|uniref:C2 domain-containing protein n=1 Tax=Pleurodeles waltl TaxID=8319 RepID=A0AAV7TRJ0_PLEWA|nr:hypothetical protein NDU88_004071 [Pleurodeles waltl]